MTLSGDEISNEINLLLLFVEYKYFEWWNREEKKKECKA